MSTLSEISLMEFLGAHSLSNTLIGSSSSFWPHSSTYYETHKFLPAKDRKIRWLSFMLCASSYLQLQWSKCYYQCVIPYEEWRWLAKLTRSIILNLWRKCSKLFFLSLCYIFLVFLKNTKVRETVKCYQLRHLPAKVDLSRLSCVFLYLLLNVYEMKFNGFLLFSFDKFFARDFFKTIFSLSASTQKKLNHEFIYSRLRYKSANKFLSLHIENILNIIIS